MTAEYVIHPTTGELRLRHDGTQRFLNRSLAWRAIEAEKLAATPDCEQCGQPATEAHNTSGRGICTISPPYNIADLVSLCSACHDMRLCTAPPVTALDRLLGWE